MPKNLSVGLILRRNIKEKDQNADKSADLLLRLTHVRLDRENLVAIENMECLGPVTNLYLQHNLIKKIENLESVASTLKFLTLSGNQIKNVEGLELLNQLQFLDLSDNMIENFEVTNLPQNLAFLSFENNNCTRKSGYRQSILNHLPELKILDGEEVFVDSDSDSEDELDSNHDQEEDNIQQTGSTLLLRSVSRLDSVAEEHRERIKEVNDQSLTPRKEDDKDQKNELNSDLTEIQKTISNVMESMVKTEENLLHNFELPVLDAPSQENQKLKTNMQDETPATPLDKIPEAVKIKNMPRPPASSKQLVSIGTTTSAASPPVTEKGHNVTEKRRPIKSSIRNMSPKTRGNVSNRAMQRIKPDTLVRIPGARPFHKY